MLFRLALTHRTQTQLSHALPYLSVHLSLPALPLSALRRVNLLSTLGHRDTFRSYIIISSVICIVIIAAGPLYGNLSVNHLEGFYISNVRHEIH